MKKTYHIINYGCQMNESDSEHFAGQLADMGYLETEDAAAASVVVMNTCCVRESAELKIYGKIGEFKHIKEINPQQILCVAGCMAQKDSAKLLRTYPQVDLIVGTSYVNNFRGLLEDFIRIKRRRKRKVYDEQLTTTDEFHGSFVRKSAHAAWVPIMYGCNNYCTYCIVPYVRGRERSRSVESIVAEIKKAIAQGYTEFTLLGQNVNSYGKELGVSFSELLATIDNLEGLVKLSYMTSHPRDMGEDVIRVIANSKHITNHFHLPVQSGSTRILKAMNRGYSREDYLALIKMVRSYVPNAVITTDIIVGFPGETEEDFQDTVSMIEEVGYDMAYTFIYSKRSGTPAVNYEGQVDEETKSKRLNALMAVQNAASLKRNQEFVGKVIEVIVEGPSHTNKAICSGRSDGNKLVLWPMGDDTFTPGDMVKIEIETAQTWLLKGRWCK